MEQNTLTLFHHIHHINGEHKVHHCGGEHIKIDLSVDYSIEHCGCGKHKIDKQEAFGHGIDAQLGTPAICVVFDEVCPEGGWHLESGKLKTLKDLV